MAESNEKNANYPTEALVNDIMLQDSFMVIKNMTSLFAFMMEFEGVMYEPPPKN